MALTAERPLADFPPPPAVHGLWPEGHLERVAQYSEMLAAAAGLDEAAIGIIRTAALVHEIGKLSVPEEILRRPGPLTPAEYEEIKRHAVHGAELCRFLPNGVEISAIVRAHHENWDGQGYPDGLAGEAIPVGARILAIAEAYDTLTMDRPFRGAFPPDEAAVDVRRRIRLESARCVRTGRLLKPLEHDARLARGFAGRRQCNHPLERLPRLTGASDLHRRARQPQQRTGRRWHREGGLLEPARGRTIPPRLVQFIPLAH
jgi:hypothetical protein